MPENWQRTMGPSVPNEYSACSPDLHSFFDAGKEHRHSELRDQSYSADKQTTEVIDGQRADESCRNRDTPKRAGTDLIHKSETGIDLDRPYETADHSPPRHLCESLRCRQRVRHDVVNRLLLADRGPSGSIPCHEDKINRVTSAYSKRTDRSDHENYRLLPHDEVTSKPRLSCCSLLSAKPGSRRLRIDLIEANERKLAVNANLTLPPFSADHPPC